MAGATTFDGVSESLAALLSPAALLNLLARGADVEVVRDLAYAPGPRGRLDLYLPRGVKKAPVVVFFYGGGWEAGEKAMYRFLGSALAADGVICAIADYRVWPEVGFPDFLRDGAAAVAWVRAHAAARGGDPSRLFLMGHSAGAHIAAMLGLDGRWLGAVGMTPAELSGVIGLSGPYDFLPLGTATLRAIFGPASGLAATQPINFVSDQAPPFLLATGGADRVVLPRNTANLAAALRAAGRRVESIVYPCVGHAPVVGAFAGPLRFVAPVRRDVGRFIGARGAA